MKDYKVEICTNSVASSIEAQRGGAYRVELCAAIPEGGTTPSYGEIVVAREELDIKLNVIIRPRSGDFLYSDVEHRAMLHDIKICKALGVDGVVFGCLTADGEVDMERNRELMEAAKGMSTTFHRAFDMSKDLFDSLEKIIELGFDRILTSGGQAKAHDAMDVLKQLIDQAGDRIIIMPGSGVTEENIAEIERNTGAVEFHFSARKPVESGMIYRNPNMKMGGTHVVIDEYANNVTNAGRVKETIKQLKANR